MNIEISMSSVICNLIASFIFLFLVLILFKPKLLISPIICKYKFYVEDEKEQYFVKVINWSLFSAYDVRIELLEVDKTPTVNNQMNSRYRDIPLVCDHFSHIPGYRPSWFRKNAPYALRFRTAQNIEKILINDHTTIIVKVTLRHGLTGLVKVISKEYTDETCVKNRKFNYGLKW